MNTEFFNQQTTGASRSCGIVLALATCIAIAIAMPALAQVEGVDPLRQITRQMGNPNLLIVLDRTGSTAWGPLMDPRIDKGYDDAEGDAGLFGFEFSMDPPVNTVPIPDPLPFNWGARHANHYASTFTDYTYMTSASRSNASGNKAENCGQCKYFPSRGAGNGYWMYAGWLPRWTDVGVPVGINFSSTTRTFIYLETNPLWPIGTNIHITGFPLIASNNGIFQTVTTPAAQDKDPYKGKYKVQLKRIKSDKVTAFWADTDAFNELQGGSRSFAQYPQMKAQKITLSATVDQIFYFVEPSRMANMKNALGDSMTVYGAQVNVKGAIKLVDAAGKTYYRFPDQVGPHNGGFYYRWPSRNWYKNAAVYPGSPALIPQGQLLNYQLPIPDLTKCGPGTAGLTDCVEPCTLADQTKCPGKWTVELPPANVVGNNVDKVNWGLMTFSSGSTALKQAVDPAVDQVGVVTTINAQFKTIQDKGISSDGSTSTRGALNEALKRLITNTTSTANKDEQRTCRPYGILLVTDGESNTGNEGDPAGDEWYNTTTPCPLSWGKFPPNETNTIYKAMWNNKVPLYARTWVIGVSQFSAGNCELNMDAFMGRTDRSSPYGDAGYLLTKDYLEVPVGSGNKKYRLLQNGEEATNPPGPIFDTANNMDYAFFANNALDLRDALKTIIDSFGHGDYTSGAPTLSYSTVSGVGRIGLVTSVEFPQLVGHLYSYGVDECRKDPKCEPLWEANAVLSGQVWDPLLEEWKQTGIPNLDNKRRIVTWNPFTKELIYIAGENKNGSETKESIVATKLNGLGLAKTDYTANDVDFIRGYDGTLTSTRRRWILGPVLNSTPAVVAEPDIWEQQKLYNHADFEEYYQNRPALVWLGSSDGMMHAFDVRDGHEVMALLPPDLLPKQSALFINYKKYITAIAAKTEQYFTVTGQPKSLGDHIYGVANHPRYADVYMGADPPPTPSASPTPNPNAYRTVLFLTEGMGGKGIHAIDVTQAHPETAGYEWANPVKILWNKAGDKSLSKTGNTTNELAGLGLSVSVPAIAARWVNGANENHSVQVTFGSGYTTWPPLPTPPASPTPKPTAAPAASFSLNPRDGSAIVSGQNKNNLVNETGTPLVNNNAFADGVISSTETGGFHPDNYTRDMERIVVDLHGHMYLLSATASGNATASLSLGGKQPLYYPVAAATMETDNKGFELYGITSGSFYERSPAVTGVEVGKTGKFIPSIILATRAFTSVTGASPTYGLLKSFVFPLQKICLPSATNNTQVCDMSALSCACPSGTYFAPRTQVTAPPAVYAPVSVGNGYFLFLAYDPDAEGCGKGYLLKINFTMDDTGFKTLSVTPAALPGKGMPGGFGTTPEGSILISQSGLGTEKAHILDTKITVPVGVKSKNRIGYWVELL